MLRLTTLLIASYALGCVVGGYYLVQLLYERDVRHGGSGNAGARNVIRTHGAVAGVLTLVLDAGKAAVAVMFARVLVGTDWSEYLAVLAVIVGHIWPVQLGGRGGKGAASALGGFLTIDPIATTLTLALGVGVLAWTKQFTKSGLIAMAAAPLSLVLLRRSWSAVAVAAAAVVVVLMAHHPIVTARRAAMGPP